MTKLSMSEEEMLKRKYTRPYEKRIAELEAQFEREKNLNQCLSDHNEQLRELIEKMKCCENCKYYNNHYNEVVCKQQVINCKRILRQATRDQWEIKEK